MYQELSCVNIRKYVYINISTEITLVRKYTKYNLGFLKSFIEHY